MANAAAERALLGFTIFPSSSARQWALLGDTNDELRKIAFSKGIEEAIHTLQRADGDVDAEETDLAVILSRVYLAEELKIEAARSFNKMVLNAPCRDASDAAEAVVSITERKHILQNDDLAGSDLKVLFNALEDLESNEPAFPNVSELSCSGGALTAARELIQATQLFGQLFPSRFPATRADHTPLSPPPSPSNLSNRHHHKRKHELRCLLGKGTFDQTSVDEARDVVVDLLTRS